MTEAGAEGYHSTYKTICLCFAGASMQKYNYSQIGPSLGVAISNAHRLKKLKTIPGHLKNKQNFFSGVEQVTFIIFFSFTNTPNNHAMLPALDAVLGHRSAHSFVTGPVMAEPFISPLLFTMTPALSSK